MLPENKIVHSLWIGDALSKLELLTIASFIDNGHTFHLWLYQPLTSEIPDGVLVKNANEIIPSSMVFCYRFANTFGHGKGSFAGFSDIFRYKLLFEKGGWWVDMDVTCIKPLDFDAPYFFRNHHDLKVVGNVMKCPAGCELMELCYNEAVVSINENNTDWLKPVEILNRHIVLLQLQNWIRPNLSNEDKWLDTRNLIWKNVTIPQSWHFLHWQNEEWRKNGVTKFDFFYQSPLANLMAKYKLYQMPATYLSKLINTIRHSSYFRALQTLFLPEV